MDNPLSTNRKRPAAATQHPMLRHAQLWRHVNGHSPEALQQHIDAMDHVLPALGKLAGDPIVTAKDVIKAVTSAVAEGKMEPSKAVANIADMPADPDKLRPWLKDRYATALATTVHAKAALLSQAQQAQPPQGVTMAPTPPTPPAAPQPAPQVAPPQGPMQ